QSPAVAVGSVVGSAIGTSTDLATVREHLLAKADELEIAQVPFGIVRPPRAHPELWYACAIAHVIDARQQRKALLVVATLPLGRVVVVRADQIPAQTLTRVGVTFG